jgi:endonuclease/exonuclease/phosphatase family metal-dependent hydrolase
MSTPPLPLLLNLGYISLKCVANDQGRYEFSMKVITWNVNNRVGTVSQQVQELGQREPDVVALQDVNYSHFSRRHSPQSA